MLNLFRPHLRATDGVEYMKILVGIKFPVSFTSLLVMLPRRKVNSAWMAGSATLSRVLMSL